MCSGYERYRKKLFLLLLILTSTKNNLRIVIHNRHKMWSKDVAFNNKFITKKCLTLYLNLSWFKLYAISPKKPAIYFSRYLQSMKRHLQAAIWDRVRVWKHPPWIFHLVDLFFFIGFNNKLYNLFFSFSCLSCDFHQHNGKKQGIDIFLAQGTHQYIIVAIH